MDETETPAHSADNRVPFEAAAVSDMERAVTCLALELPGSVWEDVHAKWHAVKADVIEVVAARDEFRGLLTEMRDWFDYPEDDPTSSDLLDRINEALA